MSTPAIPIRSAIMATGVLLEYYKDAAWVTVTGLHEAKPPQLSRKEVETTTHNRALAGGDSKRTGILRRGPVTGSINWDPGDPVHQQMEADARANTMRNFRLVLPPETSEDSTFYWTFAGAYSQFDVPNLTTDAALLAKFAITLDGDDEIVEET